MKVRIRRAWTAGVIVLAGPAVGLGDFSFGEIPQYAQDQGPDWIFQILSAILIALSQALYAMFGGTA